MYRFVLLAVFLLVSFSAHAANTVPAGFAPGSVWVSSTALTEGDAARLYTVVYNSSSASISGTVAFSSDGATVASDTFSLAAGESKIESVSWTAVAGTHTIAVSLSNVVDTGTKQAISLTNSAGGTTSITVAAKPPPPPPPPPSPALEAASSSLPIVSNVFNTVYQKTESVRSAGEKLVQTALAQSASGGHGGSITPDSNGGPAAAVLGTSTEKAAPQSGAAKASPFSSIWHTALSALLYVFQIQALFYVALLVVLYLLWKLVSVFWRDRRLGR